MRGGEGRKGERKGRGGLRHGCWGIDAPELTNSLRIRLECGFILKYSETLRVFFCANDFDLT